MKAELQGCAHLIKTMFHWKPEAEITSSIIINIPTYLESFWMVFRFQCRNVCNYYELSWSKL